MKRTSFVPGLLVLMMSQALPAQRAVSPPPRPAQSGTSLQATVDLLRRLAVRTEPIKMTAHIVDKADGGKSKNLSLSLPPFTDPLVMSATACTFTKMDYPLMFVSRISVETTTSYLVKMMALSNHSIAVNSLDQEFTAVLVWRGEDDKAPISTFFLDAQKASEYASAYARVVKLCGGSNVVLEPLPQAPMTSSTGAAGGSGPSLAVTMQFIQSKLSEIGSFDMIVNVQNLKDGTTGNPTLGFAIDHVLADASQCRINWHRKETSNGRAIFDENVYVTLASVPSLVVEPYTQFQTEQNAKNGSPQWAVTSTNPVMTAVVLRLQNRGVSYFLFSDPDVADRVARAVTHAIELCGGGNKDPF